jgi:hypothetical protein
LSTSGFSTFLGHLSDIVRSNAIIWIWHFLVLTLKFGKSGLNIYLNQVTDPSRCITNFRNHILMPSSGCNMFKTKFRIQHVLPTISGSGIFLCHYHVVDVFQPVSGSSMFLYQLMPTSGSVDIGMFFHRLTDLAYSYATGLSMFLTDFQIIFLTSGFSMPRSMLNAVIRIRHFFSQLRKQHALAPTSGFSMFEHHNLFIFGLDLIVTTTSGFSILFNSFRIQHVLSPRSGTIL